MGIVSGFRCPFSVAGADIKLQRMLEVQNHRDSSEASIYMDNHISAGMANQHNWTYCTKYGTAPGNELKHIHAFVDGIVLDSDQHADYFNSIGIPVYSQSCSSIVEAAYEKWGLGLMNHLEGEFACVIWDTKKQEMVMIRDPYGHKPLHYFLHDDLLIFSSEIKGILAYGLSLDINLVTLSDLISIGRIPNPDTLFKDIYQVEPGNILVFSNDKSVRKKRYWTHEIVVDEQITVNEAVERFDSCLRTAVKKRMVSKDTFCFLSGGIDSSAIASYAAEISEKPIQAVCVGFEEEEFDEMDDARVMAAHVGAELHKTIATYESFFDMLDLIVWHHDAPFYDTSSFPTYYAARFANKFSDIILTGDGPDQLLGGSEQESALSGKASLYQNPIIKSTCSTAAAVLGHFINNPSPSLLLGIQRKLKWRSDPDSFSTGGLSPDIIKKFLCTDNFWEIHCQNRPDRHLDYWNRVTKDLDAVNKRIAKDVRFYIQDGLMVKVDRMCMANGLETLSPFQDKSIAALANSLPGAFKIAVTENGNIIRKFLLQQCCRDRFPDQIKKKTNQGFAIPLVQWLKKNNGEFMKAVLLDDRSIKRGYFKKESLEQSVNIFLSNQGNWYYPNPLMLVLLITIELWHRKYMD